MAVQRWVVPSARLSVVLQNEAPLFPADELVDELTSGALVWRIYDGGPRDGTQISAVATSGELSIVVGGQTISKDIATPSTTELVEAIAASAQVVAAGGR